MNAREEVKSIVAWVGDATKVASRDGTISMTFSQSDESEADYCGLTYY
jgi:hypothetical protein